MSNIVSFTVSRIATLANRRAGLIQAAVEANRDLTGDELATLRGLEIEIAYLPATNRKDAQFQLAVSLDLLDLVIDGVTDPEQAYAAGAARVSAEAILGAA